VLIPRLHKHQQHQRPHQPAPAIIAPSIALLTDNTASRPSQNARQKTAKIIGRAGLERLGRFQHDEMVYDVEITGKSGTIVQQVDCRHILEFVTLQELEFFENAQFEQELTYEPLLPVHQQKRGRPPKRTFHAVGLSSDDESVYSDVIESGVAVVVPLRRGRERPPKKLKIDKASLRLSRRGNADYQYVSLPQVKKRVKKPLPRDKSQASGSSGSSEALQMGEWQDEAINAYTGSIKAGLETPRKQSVNDQLDELSSLPASATSHFKSSSQLVKAAQQATDTEDDLQPSHQNKPARGRPRKAPVKVASSDEDDLESVHEQFQLKRPDKPRKTPPLTPKVEHKDYTSTEDELLSIQEKFGVFPSKNTSSHEVAGTPTPTKLPNARLNSLSQDKASGGQKPRPSPRNRPGYVAPSLSRRPVESDSSDAVASSSSMTSSPLRPDDAAAELDTSLSLRHLRDNSNAAFASSGSSSSSKVPIRHALPSKQLQISSVIEISSDDCSSSSAASRSKPKITPAPTSVPLTKPSRARPDGMPIAAVSKNAVEPTNNTSTRESQDSTTDSADSSSDNEDSSSDSENEDEDETAHIMDVEIPEIPSSDSFIASDSSSQRSESEERYIQPGEVLKTKRIADKIGLPHTKRVQPREASKPLSSFKNSNELTVQYALNRPPHDRPWPSFQQNKPVPGKSRFPQSRVSMQKNSQQVAERSRAEVESQKQRRAPAPQQSSSSSSVESTSDSDSPPARPKPERKAPPTQRPHHKEPFSSTFRNLAAANEQPLPLHPQAQALPLHPSPRLSHPPPLPLHPPSPHSQLSLSLGESSPPARPRKMSIDLGTPQPTKKKKVKRASMTPLFPGRSPVHGRKVFSTREFE
ncbi:MAG: hypothetical protein Q9195_009587, partial [Heterodermia aff. obscurata]